MGAVLCVWSIQVQPGNSVYCITAPSSATVKVPDLRIEQKLEYVVMRSFEDHLLLSLDCCCLLQPPHVGTSEETSVAVSAGSMVPTLGHNFCSKKRTTSTST